MLWAFIGFGLARAEPANPSAAIDAQAARSDVGAEPAPARLAAAEAPPPSLTPSVAAPSSQTRASNTPAAFRALIAREAERHGLAPAVAEAVMAVESGFNPDAVGGSGEIGLMQVMPSTARMLGFLGSNAELAVPETNIRYGVTYLARAWRLAGGDICTATMKYRAGHGETRFSHLSVKYCVAVRGQLAALGFPVTGQVPVASFGSPSGGGAGFDGGCRRRCLAGNTVGRVDLAALNARLNTLVVQVRSGR
ncbi:lytic transglycosylase domain-containing protein [Rhodopseudomonas palustris]|uniref:lytic transglycosylase domain-containing protein n=1 Tax=Rhodopseudomonas palustris TaxID=1076 RepID=UPI003A10334C